MTSIARTGTKALMSDPAQAQRRILRVLVTSQILSGAGLAAGVTVGALLAEDMLGSTSLAGLPSALFTAGSALAAIAVGRVSQARGRRPGLATGYLTGALGSAGVITAAVLDNPVLLFTALFVYGAGTATNLQARYAGTDLAHADRRATAVSMAMVSTTIGAVAGPNLVGPLGSFARSVGAPALAGPFMLGAVAYASAGTVLFLLLRPDPFLVSRSLVDAERRSATDGSAATAGAAAAEHPEMPASVPSTEPVRPAVRVGSGAYLGAAVMVITQMAMVAIMTMTPVHMRAHGHDIGDVGLVIGFHIGAMYLPSLVTGVLVDRVGRIRMVVVAAFTMLAAGLAAAFAPAESLPVLVFALVLLGVGWNIGLISGTALVVDATEPHNRARVQGTIDVGVALAGAGGGAVSGVIAAGSSYAALSLIGGGVSLVLIPVVLVAGRHEARRRTVVT